MRNDGNEKELREETVYDRMLTSNLQIKDTGKPPIRHTDLSEEGASLLVAGTETSATTLAYATYYILAHPKVERRVLEDLATVERDENRRLSLVKIEALPYLVGQQGKFCFSARADMIS
jgi:cytochrome P450